MLNRVVSLCSFFMVILSVVAFGLGAWWTFVGAISVGDGVFMICGWCVSAVIFSYRALDPDYSGSDLDHQVALTKFAASEVPSPITKPLPYGRGSDQSRDRKGAVALHYEPIFAKRCTTQAGLQCALCELPLSGRK